jgi:hypothetical protein
LRPISNSWRRPQTKSAPRHTHADNDLRVSSLANDPPSKTFYDPERDGIRFRSLGVHEHWNNVTDKKYSRNLDGKAHGSSFSKPQVRNMLEPSPPMIDGFAQLQIGYRQ